MGRNNQVITFKNIPIWKQRHSSKTEQPKQKLFGEETYKQCCLGAFRGKIYFDYKYRHTNGQEFTTLRRTLDTNAVPERDFWLREKTVSFSGHRAERMTRNSLDTQKRLTDIGFDTYTAITELCKRDYHTFLSGMANGFDLIAAEEVLNARKEFPYIQLKCVLPFKGQADRYTQADKQRYNTILAQADEVIILQDEYSDRCFLHRNNYLLDNSAYLVVFYDSTPTGGTAYTLRQAMERKIEFQNVCYNRK